ncbi:serine/threonine protein kinase [Ktedonospora formicarum]|uniref:non-specific serine/threonine protein kinase n=1 Tax=Ktedonospora formicarum TaxID=2778364 RepID=A0A8J3I1I7_9CHLR|nr:serine/threonine-protein kinase [Ktedonospora formicarum]GHO45075.1 hypothetical protein KSX_32380 [Ktedonospora formicarum]
MSSQTAYCAHCGAANPGTETTCFACQQPLQPQEEGAFLIGKRYRILDQVGSGGFGAVYKVADTQQNDALRALKQINLRTLSPQQAIEATDAFNREVALLSQLKHTHLPRVHDHFTDPEHWYLLLDFIEGETLEMYLERQPRPSDATTPASFPQLAFADIFDIAFQLCDVLTYLHTRHPPIVFRDLKPANIMRTPTGELYLIDFGIARHFKPGQQRDTMPFGSPGYAAPEQYGKAQTTPTSDVYSLGALLHHLLSGQDPAETPFQFDSLQGYGPAGINELVALIQRMVALDPLARPASIAEVANELHAIASLQGIRPPNRSTRRLASPQPISLPPTVSAGSQRQGQIQAQKQVQRQVAPGQMGRRVVVAGLTLSAVAIVGERSLVAPNNSSHRLIDSLRRAVPLQYGQESFRLAYLRLMEIAMCSFQRAQ